MIKKVLCAVMAMVLSFSTLAAAPQVSAAKVPKAAYTFNMNKKSKKVVAVARKGDNTSTFTAKETTDNIGVLPTSYHAWTYVNGELYGNGTVAKATMSNKNKFFLGINCWDCPFKGYYDDVQLWKKALNAKQVKKLYKSVK